METKGSLPYSQVGIAILRYVKSQKTAYLIDIEADAWNLTIIEAVWLRKRNLLQKTSYVNLKIQF
jgi:hypothetical protein